MAEEGFPLTQSQVQKGMGNGATESMIITKSAVIDLSLLTIAKILR